MTIPMPEPVAYRSKDQPYLFGLSAPTGSSERWDGLITTTQAEAYADARVREALEAAAQACEARIGQHAPGMTPEDVEDCDEEARLCAGAIRALIPPLPGPVEPTT